MHMSLLRMQMLWKFVGIFIAYWTFQKFFMNNFHETLTGIGNKKNGILSK